MMIKIAILCVYLIQLSHQYRYLLDASPSRSIDQENHFLVDTDNSIVVVFESQDAIGEFELSESLGLLAGTRIKLMPFIKEGSILFLNHVNRPFSYVNYVYESIGLELAIQYLQEKEENLREDRAYIPYHRKVELNNLQKSYRAVLRDNIKLKLDLSIPDAPLFHDAYAEKMRRYMHFHLEENVQGRIRSQMACDMFMMFFNSSVFAIEDSSDGRKAIVSSIQMHDYPLVEFDPQYYAFRPYITSDAAYGYEKVQAKGTYTYEVDQCLPGNRIHLDENHYDKHGFLIETINERTFTLSIELPSETLGFKIDEETATQTRMSNYGFTGTITDMFNVVYWYEQSNVTNILSRIPGNDGFDIYLNITAIDGIEVDSSFIDVEMMIVDKSIVHSPSSVLWTSKILQFSNPVSLIPNWFFSPAMVIKSDLEVAANDGTNHLTLTFNYPISDMVQLQTMNDILEHNAIVEESCPICMSEFRIGRDIKRAPFKYPKCRHCAHHECIMRSLHANDDRDECPLCRQKQNFLRVDIHNFHRE